ncbi:MAG: hypothetical protein ABL888_02125 [Pirellulaceae bacterium]
MTMRKNNRRAGIAERICPAYRTITQCGWIFVLSLLMLTSGGCQVFQRFRTNKQEAPIVLAETSSLPQVIAKINEQSRRVNTLKTDARISVDGMPNLRGDLVLERPDNLRLKAGLMGMSEMGFDLGTNKDLFWVWKKMNTPGDPPTLYYAYHDEYRNSAIKEQLQLQPKWLLEGIGLIEFSPESINSKPRNDGLLEIASRDPLDPNGPFRVAVVDPRRGLILQQTFYTAQGNRLAYINSVDHRFYAEKNVSLPGRLEIHVFDPEGRETKMAVYFGEFAINAFYGDRDAMWSMPNPGDVPKINLSEVGKQAVETEAAAEVSRNWDPHTHRR